MKSLMFPLDSFNMGLFMDIEKYSGIDDLIIFNNVKVNSIINVQFLDSDSVIFFRNTGILEIHTIPNLKDRFIVDGVFKNTKSSLVKIFDIGLILAFNSSKTCEISNVAVKKNLHFSSRYEEEYYVLFTEYSNTKDRVNSISLYSLKKPILRKKDQCLQNLKSKIKLEHVYRHKPISSCSEFNFFSVFNFKFSFLKFPIFITVEEKGLRRLNIYGIQDYKIVLINQVADFYEGYLAEESVVADFFGQREFTRDRGKDEGSYFSLLNKHGTISLLEIFKRKPIDGGKREDMRGLMNGSVDILDDFIDLGKGSKVFVTFDSEFGGGNFFEDSDESNQKMKKKESSVFTPILEQIEETMVIKSKKIIMKKSKESDQEKKSNFVISENLEVKSSEKIKTKEFAKKQNNSYFKTSKISTSNVDDKFAFKFFDGGCSNLLTFREHNSSDEESMEEIITEKPKLIEKKTEKKKLNQRIIEQKIKEDIVITQKKVICKNRKRKGEEDIGVLNKEKNCSEEESFDIKFDYNMDFYDPYLSTFQLKQENEEKKFNLYFVDNNKENCEVKREFYRKAGNSQVSEKKDENIVSKIHYSQISQVEISHKKPVFDDEKIPATTKKFSFKELEHSTKSAEDMMSMTYSNCSKETIKRRVYCDKKKKPIMIDSMNESKHVVRNQSKVIKESSKYILLSDENPENVKNTDEELQSNFELDSSFLKVSSEELEEKEEKKDNSDIQMVESFINDDMILGKERDIVLRATEKLKKVSLRTGRGKTLS